MQSVSKYLTSATSERITLEASFLSASAFTSSCVKSRSACAFCDASIAAAVCVTAGGPYFPPGLQSERNHILTRQLANVRVTYL
jgi:hypothetical protein